MKPIGIELRLGGEREVESGLRRVGGAMDSVGTAASGLARAVGGVAGAFAGVVSIREFVQAADAVTSLQNRLKLATGSAQAAGTAYNELFLIAQRSRTGFVELGQIFASVSTSAADLGISQQRLLKVTEAIGNAVTISGSSAQAANAALAQLGQGLASGTLRGEELNSVMEQLPRLAKALDDGLGVTRGELRALGQQGAITAEQVIKALESQSSVLQGEVKDATMTVGQAFTQLQNSAVMAVGEFDKATGATNSLAGTISTLAGVVGDLGGVIRDNEGAFKILGGTLAGAAVVAGAAGVVKSLGLISGAVAGLGTVLLANPAVLALLGIGAAVGGGIALVSAQSKTASGIEQAIARLQGENDRSAAAMERALAGGRLAGADNIAKAIDARKDQIAKLRAELDSLGSAPAGAGGGSGSVNPQTVGAMALEQAAGEKELAAIRQKLYGVDKDYLPTLTKLHAQYQSGRLTLGEYQELVGKLAEANYKKEKSGAGAAAGLKEQQNAYEQLITSINVKIAQEREELAGGGALTDSQKLRIKLDQELASGKIKLSAAQKASLDTAIGALSIVEQEVAASKELAKAAQTRVDARAREADGIAAWMRAEEDAARQSLDSVRARVSGLLEEEAAVTLATSLNISLAEAIERVAIERMREKQAGFIEGSEGWQAIEREIAARKELLGLVSSKAQREDEARGWADMWQSVDRTAHDVFVDVAKNGMNAFERIGKTLEASVLDVLYQMTVRKWMINIGTSVFGAGFGAAANAATGGGAGGALSAVGSIGSGYSMLSALGGTFGGGLSAGFGGLMGSLGMSATGATFGGAMSAGSIAMGAGNIAGGLGTLAGALGPIAIGIALLSSIIKKSTPHMGAASSYSAADGLVSGVDVYRASGLADTRTYSAEAEKVTATVAQSIAMALDSTAVAFGKKAGYEISTAFADDKSKDGAWGSLIIKQMGEAVIDWRDTQTSKWAPREFADGEQGGKEYQQAIAKSVREVIDGMGLPEWAARITRALPESATMDDLTAALAQVQAYPAQLLQQFGTTRDALVQQFAQGLASGDAMAAGQSVADTLVASIQNAIYTNAAAQIFDIVNQGIVTPMLDAIATGASVADALSQATIDKTIERAKAQAQVLGELFGNQEFAAAMEQLRTAVGGALGQAGGYLQALPNTLAATQQIDTAAQDAARAADEAQKAWQQITDGLLSDQGALQIELLRAQGREEEALAAERTKAIEGYDAYQTALYDSNTALRLQITELERMAEVSRTLASELPAVLDKFRTPEQRTKAQYSSIAGDLVGAGLSGADVGSLAGALESMSKEQIATAAVEIYNMAGVTDDMRLALVRAVAGLGELKDAALEVERAIAAERTGLEGQILQLQGKTAELRSRELAALDESNRSLQKRIYILQDEDRVRSARDSLASGYAQIVGAEQAARDGITSGFLAAQDALDAVIARGNDALRDMASGIRDFVQGIDASEAGGLGIDGRLAAAQANFSIAKAQALSGDSNAQQSLTGLAGDVLALAKDASASQSDYLREVARIKNSLGDVAAQADGKAGPATEATQTEMLKAQQEVQRWAEAAAISGASTTEAVKSYSADWAKAQHDLMQANALLSEAGIAASALNVKQPLDDLRASIETLTGAMRDLAAFDPGNKLLDEITNGTGGALPGGSAGVSAGVFDEAALRTMYREGAMLNSEAMTAAMQITMGGGSLDGYSHAAAAGWTEQQKLTERFFSNIQRSLMMDSQIAAAMSAQGVNSVIDWLASVVDYKTGSFVLENGAGGGRSRYQLPGFASGINRVPYDMTANLHRDEAVIPAQFNPFNPGAQAMQSDPELLAELKALRAEVASLRQSNSSENAAIAGSSLRAAKVLERVAPNGDAIATRAAEELA